MIEDVLPSALNRTRADNDILNYDYRPIDWHLTEDRHVVVAWTPCPMAACPSHLLLRRLPPNYRRTNRTVAESCCNAIGDPEQSAARLGSNILIVAGDRKDDRCSQPRLSNDVRQCVAAVIEQRVLGAVCDRERPLIDRKLNAAGLDIIALDGLREGYPTPRFVG